MVKTKAKAKKAENQLDAAVVEEQIAELRALVSDAEHCADRYRLALIDVTKSNTAYKCHAIAKTALEHD